MAQQKKLSYFAFFIPDFLKMNVIKECYILLNRARIKVDPRFKIDLF